MFSLRVLSRQLPRIGRALQGQLLPGLTSKSINALSLRSLSECIKDRPLFLGCRADYANELTFINPENIPAIPIYRILDLEGKVVGKGDPNLDKDTLLKIYKTMVQMHIMDTIFYDAKHSGRIEFYITSLGEEGLLMGSAAALSDKDPVWSQYRESGVLLWRGFTYDQFLAQLQWTIEDNCKGHNMQLHYGSRKLNFQTVSAPLTTQLPQAVGDAYRIKMENSAEKNKRDRRIVACYFGEGAASEGDFHAAMNFAATLDCPIMFLCRNNGYAISTHVSEQYRGDAIACRAPAYGMIATRVDGNDPLAVYKTVKEARKTILDQGRPVFVELMSYRVGHHTASDDSFAYRSKDEVEFWKKTNNPITRLKRYLMDRNMWSSDEDVALILDVQKDILKALSRSERMKKPNPLEMFADVYYDGPDGSARPKPLRDQVEKFREHISKYGQHYPLKNYAPIPQK